MTTADPGDAPFRRTDPLAGAPPAGDPALSAWLGELAADEAARQRARGHSLGRQAAEEGTFTGILADLAERGRPVLVHLHNGRQHRGVASVVGTDFVVIRAGTGRAVAIARTAVASVRTPPGEAPTMGDRPVRASATLAEMVSTLVDDRTRVTVMGLDPRHTVSGELRAVGRDVLTVRLDGDGGVAYVALDSVAEISLVESG